MGWCNPEVDGHEGYVVGLVDESVGHRQRWRELNYDHDKKPVSIGIQMLQAACECGWRSRMFHAPIVRPPKWYPYTISVDEQTEDGALILWNEHVEQERRRTALTLAAVAAGAKGSARA